MSFLYPRAMQPGRTVLMIGTIAATACACSLIVDTGSLSGGRAPDDAGSDARVAASDASVGPDGEAGARCSDGQKDPSLVLYLPFDEESGATATDCSGRGHDGTLLGNVAGSRVAGHSGKAVMFDGTQTCVDLGTPSDFILTGPFTVAAWIKVDEYEVPAPANDSRAILSKTKSATASGWRFVTQGAGSSTGVGFKVGTASGSDSVTSPTPQPVATWIHAAGVWVPNDRAEVYVGGALVKKTTTIPPILEDAAQTLYAGCVRPGAQHFKGTMDELRIYNRALTEAEIAVLAR